MMARVRWAVGALVLATGCLSQPAGLPEPMACEAAPPPDAEYAHDTRENHDAYAGTYRLMLVATQPRGVAPVVGTLHLEPQDSTARPRGRYFAGLIGWFDSEAAVWPWRHAGGRRDPSAPGAQLAGLDVRLGETNATDGAFDHLRITARSARGFWGWWVESTGIAVPLGAHPAPARAGFFCAIRTNVGDADETAK